MIPVNWHSNIYINVIDFNQNHCVSKGQLQSAVLYSLLHVLTEQGSM